MMGVGERLRRFRRVAVKSSGRQLLRLLDRFLGWQSLIGDRPFFPNEMFDYLHILEANFAPIRAELETVMKLRDHVPSFHEISPDQKRISIGDNWKTFVLFGFGHRAERNCRLCPHTAQTLEKLPKLQNAWFSILSPGYKIPPHRGVTKGLLRVHLGLLVPQQADKCFIRVGDQIRHWEEGGCMVFDDTFDHEVQNNTPDYRAVLFIDVERPLRLPGRLVNRGILRLIQWTAYVKDARRNLDDWEDRLQTAVQRAESFTVDMRGKADGSPKDTPPV